MKYRILDVPPPTSLTAVLRGLAIGQGAEIEGRSGKQVATIASQVLGAGRYTCRKIEGGVRIWRLA